MEVLPQGLEKLNSWQRDYLWFCRCLHMALAQVRFLVEVNFYNLGEIFKKRHFNQCLDHKAHTPKKE